MFTVEGNALTLTDVQDGKVVVYMAYEEAQSTVPGSTVAAQ